MNIYAGNLHFKMGEEDLKGIFEEYGQVVSVKIVTDRETGRSKGFGFVEMADNESGREAVKELNGAEVMGRTIKVNEARQREERPERSERRSGGYGDNRRRQNFRSSY